MRLTRLALASGTALTISMGWAMADGNETDLLQNGDNNIAEINQSAGNDNIAGNGDRGTPLVQSGDNNDLTINQSGNRNEIGLRENAWNNTTGILQSYTNDVGSSTPRSNLLEIRQSSDDNVVGAVSQAASTQGGGSRNSATIIQRGGNDNEVGSVRQTKRSSSTSELFVDQSGSNNRIAKISQSAELGGSFKANMIDVRMTGDDNGRGRLTGVANVAGVETSTLQQGEPGTLTNGSQESAMNIVIGGNSNQFGAAQYGNLHDLGLNVSGDDNQIGSYQQGVDNAVTANISGDANQIGSIQNGELNTLALNSVSGSDNDILSNQDGTNNNILASVSGDFNDIEFDQDGTDQFANANISGSTNQLLVRQENGTTGTGNNSATVNIGGDFNGLGGSLSTIDGDLLTSGELLQSGSDNILNMTVRGDRNEFAVSQVGSGNTFTGLQQTDHNQMAVLQTGDGNMATVTQ